MDERRWPLAVIPALVGVLAVAATVLLLHRPEVAGNRHIAGARERMAELTNADRADADLSPLVLSLHVSRHARRHTRAMVDAGFIFHSTTGQLRRYLEGFKWEIIGENVGEGESVVSLEEAFMASEDHRENVLNEDFTHMAVGVVRDDEAVWITVVYWG